MVELVDSLASGASARKGVLVRLPLPVPKGKTSAFSRCLSFWVPPPEGRLHPSAFKCSGSAEPPLRNSRPVAGNLRATRRAAQKGRGAILPQGSRQSKISILTIPSTKKDICEADVLFCELRRLQGGSTLRYLNARGSRAAPTRSPSGPLGRFWERSQKSILPIDTVCLIKYNTTNQLSR